MRYPELRLDYTQGEIRAAPFDVILDAVMNQAFSRWRPLLNPQGVYVALLTPPGLLWHSLTLPLYSLRR